MQIQVDIVERAAKDAKKAEFKRRFMGEHDDESLWPDRLEKVQSQLQYTSTRSVGTAINRLVAQQVSVAGKTVRQILEEAEVEPEDDEYVEQILDFALPDGSALATTTWTRIGG